MSMVNTGKVCQISVETGAPGIKTAAAILRRQGFAVVCVPLGLQVTQFGTVRMTMLHIEPGSNQDTQGVEEVAKSHIPSLRN